MELLKEKKFWAALGLGLALCALMPLGIVVGRPGHDSSWERQVLPWLQMTLVYGIIVLIAFITGIRFRPQRPERLAAGAGALLMCIYLVITQGHILNILATIAGYILGGRSWQLSDPGQIAIWLDPLRALALSLIPMSLASILMIAVICLLAANYWKVRYWKPFWKGPGGAILKGGIIAGLIVLPISFTLVWYKHTVLLPQYFKQLGGTAQFYFSWVWPFISELRGIILGAVITAILVPLRPKPGLGAFAGGGLALGLAALIYLLLRLSGQHFSIPPWFAGVYILQALSQGLLGAIAGSFAGRWSETEIAKTE